jgi:hypothetical protein
MRQLSVGGVVNGGSVLVHFCKNLKGNTRWSLAKKCADDKSGSQ